jgi:hypothetical protein
MVRSYEVQLAVKVTIWKFSKNSNDFHHFFYELKRSHFSPLVELCSILNYLNPKSQIYH